MGRPAVISNAVLEMMYNADCHAWTLEEIRDGLLEKGLAADFSSVFRAMERLTSNLSVRKIDVEDGKSHFELPNEHHDHIRCEGCGRLAAIPCGLLDGSLAELESRTDFAILGHSLIFTGKCSDCQSSQSALS